MDIVFSTILNGISYASILLLVALGLNIIFGMMGVVNFAHGEFVMLGTYVSYMFSAYFGKADYTVLHFLLVVICAFVLVAAIGFLVEKLLIRYLYNHPYRSILATVGLSLILQQVARNVFGTNNVEVIVPSFLEGGLQLTETISFPNSRLFILCTAIITTGLFVLAMNLTSFGRQIKAVFQNRTMAECIGLNIEKLNGFTFAIGAGIAGVAGIGISLLSSVGPTTGQNYIVEAFLVVIIGGIGSIRGTIISSLLVGLMFPFLQFVLGSTMGKLSLMIIIVLLLYKYPKGFVTLSSRDLD